MLKITSVSKKNTLHKLSERPLLFGTFMLTATGVITRLIGFSYRIYLSKMFGEEALGIYQLIAPVLALSFSLCAAACQTAISKFVAEAPKSSRFSPFWTGLLLSMPLSLLTAAAVFCFAPEIASHLLLEPRTENLLRILSFSIPLSSLHACINGYFYGLKKTVSPSVSQLAEQLARVGSVHLVCSLLGADGKTPSVGVAVLGIFFGELTAVLLSLFFLYRNSRLQPPAPSLLCSRLLYGMLMMSVPLTLNRLTLNLLQSVESVSIPARLKLFGYDTSAALSVYGVLTGMAMPLILFPNALTTSVAVLLLPLISEQYAAGDMDAVSRTIGKTLRACLLLGSAFFLCFFFFGTALGNRLFSSSLAGRMISALSFLCPFLYLNTTLSSILQGLGKAASLFAMNVTALSVRLLFVLFCIPRYGLSGYLWGILIGQILLSALYLSSLFSFTKRSRPAS